MLPTLAFRRGQEEQLQRHIRTKPKWRGGHLGDVQEQGLHSGDEGVGGGYTRQGLQWLQQKEGGAKEATQAIQDQLEAGLFFRARQSGLGSCSELNT